MKKFLSLIMLIACFASCSSDKAPEVKLDEFTQKAPELVDQTITVTGIAKHICHNSGRKIFLTPNLESDVVVNVTAGETIDRFDIESQGKTYKITGVVKVASVIDEAYLDQWEKEVIEQGVQEGTHICATEQQAEGIEIANNEENPQMARIKSYRAKIEENNGEPLIFYHIVCNTFEIE